MSMENLTQIREAGLEKITACESLAALQQLRVLYLGKKGPIQDLMKSMKDLPKEERPAFGQQVNALKQTLAEAIEEKKTVLEKQETAARLEKEKIDITLGGRKANVGNIHPLQLVQREIEDLFIGLGYSVEEGPEVELDFYNFERANIPKDHPARDMQDTFYIDVEHLLRTHTTAIQMRVLEKDAPRTPVKVICPGKVYRRDDDDATHSHQFTQVEGLVVGENIRRSEGHAGICRQAHVRREARHPLPPQLFPVHRTERGSRCLLPYVRRKGLPDLQGNRMDRDPGRRHGAPQCIAHGRL